MCAVMNTQKKITAYHQVTKSSARKGIALCVPINKKKIQFDVYKNYYSSAYKLDVFYIMLLKHQK